LTCIKGGRVVDPAHARDAIGDVWIRDGRVVDPPAEDAPEETYDATGKIVMAGAIDIHSHIAGDSVNAARLLLPELHRASSPDSASGLERRCRRVRDRMPLCDHGVHDGGGAGDRAA